MNTVAPTHWGRLSRVLDELMDLPAAERAEHLAVLRAGDAALADELAGLLVAMDALQETPFMRHAAAPARRVSPSGREGDRVGAYRLERLLGEGGMGSVWLGRRSDGRYEGLVAIKFLLDRRAGPEHAQRFLHEGQLLGRLDHPNVARLLDAGLVPATGQPYLVLEHVEGLPIDAYCTTHGLALRPRLKRFMDVLAAVAHAHERLILHRDLKPANILVTAKGEVKLLDFGIAEPLAEAAPVSESGTSTSPVRAAEAFTPRYAAPEQLDHGTTTTATDVYALGVLLHLLLTGSHPAAVGETSAPAGRAAVPRLASDVVLAAGGPSARQDARALRGDLDCVVAKALQTRSADRYRNAAELADDLRRYLDHEPLVARRYDASDRAAKFVRRHRFGVAAGVTVALALGVGTGLALWKAHEARAQSARADQQRRQAEGLLEFMLGDLRDKLEPVSRLDLLDAVASRALAYYAGQVEDPRDVDGLSRRARALRQLGLLEEKRGRMDEAQQELTHAARITGELAARFPDQARRLAEHGDSLSAQAQVAARLVRLDAALAFSREALAWRQRALALQPADPRLQMGVADAWVELGAHLVNMHRPADALAPLNEGLVRTLAQATTPELNKKVVNIRSTLGDAYFGLYRYAQAVAVLEPHWTALTDVPGGAADPELRRWRAEGLNRLSGSLLRLGRLQEADRASREAVSQFADLSANDAANLNLLNALCHFRAEWAQVLLAEADLARARVQLQQAAAGVDRLLAADPESEDVQFATRARVLSLQAETTPDDPAVAKALQDWLDEVVPHFEARPRPLNAYSLAVAAWAGLALGDVRAAHGHRDAARLLWQRAAQRAAGPAAAGNALAITRLAALNLRLGDYAAAASWSAKLPTGYASREHTDVLRRLASRAG